MKSQDVTRTAPSGQRTKLIDAVPLANPLVIQIFDTYACNLACQFCHYGLDKYERPKLSTKTFMTLELFQKIVDDMKGFESKIKLLRFCGAGESLLNPHIVEMVDYAVKSGVAEKVELITNGILLTPKVSLKLIESGLSQLRVSVYGLDSQKYQEVAKRKVDFDAIVENVKFFYEEKVKLNSDVKIYVKTMDVSLDERHDEQYFIDLFGQYSDSYAIERVVPNVQGLDYSTWLEQTPLYNALGVDLPEIKICPQPYHLVTICPDGRVVPCSNETMVGIGNVEGESIVDIWSGDKLREVQREMINGSRNYKGVSCETCTIVQCRPFPEDILDHGVNKLREIFN